MKSGHLPSLIKVKCMTVFVEGFHHNTYTINVQDHKHTHSPVMQEEIALQLLKQEISDVTTCIY